MKKPPSLPSNSPSKAKSRQRPPVTAPAPPQPEPPAAPEAPAISIEQFLAYQRGLLGEGDALLVATVVVYTGTTEVCRINVNTTLPMLLQVQQMAHAPAFIEDQLQRTIVKPVIGVIQQRVTEASHLATRDEQAYLGLPTLSGALPPTPPQLTNEQYFEGAGPAGPGAGPEPG